MYIRDKLNLQSKANSSEKDTATSLSGSGGENPMHMVNAETNTTVVEEEPYHKWLDVEQHSSQLVLPPPINILNLPMKTPEPRVGQVAKNAVKRTIFLANESSNEKNKVEQTVGQEDQASLFQYTPSNYYDTSGGGTAVGRFYREQYIKQLNLNNSEDDQNMPPIVEKED